MEDIARSGAALSPAGPGQIANAGVQRRPQRNNSRSGCATCRRRKVRCDQRRDVCGNCSRLELSCRWYRPNEVSQRSRVNTACERCRKKKIRCISESDTGTCMPCRAAQADCVNTANQESHSSRTTSSTRSTATATMATIMPPAPQPATVRQESPSSWPNPTAAPSSLPARDEQRRLLKFYFSGPHYFCFYTFIHPPTFLQLFDADLVPHVLLLVVMATALRFLDPRDRRADGWADECRRLVMRDIFSPPSTTTLQALLLLQRLEWHRGGHVAAWFISGLAVRLAHGLQMNLEIAGSGPATDARLVPVTLRETRRRLMWSCFVMESMIENGRSPLASLAVGSIEVRLPCTERSFRLGLEANVAGLEDLCREELGSARSRGQCRNQSRAHSQMQGVVAGGEASRLGISAFLVKLAVLRREILDYTLPYHPRNNGHIPPTAPWVPGSPFFEYEEKLEQWKRCLPDDLQFTADVLYRRQEQLVSFVTLHCLFHGCYCDLYRIGSYITSLHRASSSGSGVDFPAPSAAFLVACRRGRVQHAFAICKVISESMKHHPSGHDPVVGIGASLAMRVLIIERQHEEDGVLGLTDETVYESLHAAVQCAKEIAQRSVPIRELFCSVCELARKYGYYVDLTDIGSPPSTPIPQQPQDRERAESPSLRTYGTFGRIQNSLARRRDVLAPAVSVTTDKESDLFHNFSPPANNTTDSPQQMPPAPPSDVAHAAEPVPIAAPPPPPPHEPDWGMDSSAASAYPYLAYETYSPNEFGVASAWGDGTLNFSMMPAQFDWVNQSLGFDFNNSVQYDAPQGM